MPHPTRIFGYQVLFATLLATCMLPACADREKPKASEDADAKVAAPVKLDLWQGVPPLKANPDDFATELLPAAGDGPKKPVSVSERVELPFPPPIKADRPEPKPPGPLTILRSQPTGNGAYVDAVSVTFNQPMVPLASVDDLRKHPVPLKVEPQPPGKFRWLGTDMVAFVPEGRMPMSTTYRASVDAGVASQLGGKLEQAYTWSFTTPALELQSHSPSTGQEGVSLTPEIRLIFNQRIDRDKLAAQVSVKGGGGNVAFDVVPAVKESEGKQSEQEQRTLVLKPSSPLRPNTGYAVTIPPGVYGEGPNRSGKVSFGFRTYAPLRLSGPKCTDRSYDCYPGTVQISSNNYLDGPTFENHVTVEPPVENLKVNASSGIYLSGEFLGTQTYTVTVGTQAKDTHGQSLARPYKVTFKMPKLDPGLAFFRPQKSTTVLEPSHNGIVDLRVTGLSTVEARTRTFSAGDLNKWLSPRYRGETIERTAWPVDVEPFTGEKVYTTNDSVKKVKKLGLNLSEALPKTGSMAFLNVRSNPVKRWGELDRWHLNKVFQRTDLGVTAALDRNSGVVLVTSLERGEPVANAKVSLLSDRGESTLWTGTTDAQGLAEIKQYSGQVRRGYLLVEHGQDASFTPLQHDVHGGWYGGYYGNDSPDPIAFFYTDRTPYKPGDTIHLSGILRQRTKGPDGGVGLWRTGFEADYVVNGPRGHELTKGTVKVTPFGTFQVDIPTEKTGDTGRYSFNMTVPGGLFGSAESFHHSIPVETYRAPEFTVAVERDGGEAPLYYGNTLKANVRGKYLHGAPLVGGEVSYTIRRENTAFVPPGPQNAEFTFGQGRGNYWGGRHRYGRGSHSLGGSTQIASQSGVLDGRGLLAISQVLEPTKQEVKEGEEPPVPLTATYNIEAQVTDTNYQAIAGRASFVVHPSDNYVGVRSQRSVYREGERARIEAIVVDTKGQRVSDRELKVELVRRETERKAVEKDGRWVYEYNHKDEVAGSCDLTSKDAPVVCDVEVKKAGNYTVKAKAADEAGRRAESSMTFYVHGDDAVIWQEDQHRVDLVPDRRSYKPGDTAKVLVRAPFAEARGLVVVEREGIVAHYPVQVSGGTATVDIPVKESMLPNFEVSAVVVRGRVDVPGAPPGQDLGRPAHAAGQVDIEVDTATKKIDIELVPHKTEVAPGGKLRLDIDTRDHTGVGTKAAVAVMVVDEGVLSLMDFQTPNPLEFFHNRRSGQVTAFDLRTYLLAQDETSVAEAPERERVVQEEAKEMEDVSALLNPSVANKPSPKRRMKKKSADRSSNGFGGLGLSGTGRGGGGTGAGTIGLAMPAPAVPGGGAVLDPNLAMQNSVKLRTLLKTTAYFNPEVMTDETGKASLEIDMPENLTTFRVMAVAVDPEVADRFGSADTSVVVRKPIMVRPSMPRFANYGDKFKGTVMVDNQTDVDQAVLVGTRGLNVLFEGKTEQQVTIPAGESRAVSFPMATDQVGNLRLQFAALANGGRDATEVTLPVNYPATRQAFATYGMTDANVVQTVQPPKDALPGFGGLELSLSSTALTGLEDAVTYLFEYRYECTEQLASRLLPIFTLGPVLEQFPIAETRDLERRKAMANAGIAKIVSRQNSDGGFRYWDSRGRSYGYLTAWTTFALLEAKREGFEVDDNVIDRANRFLRRYVERGDDGPWGRTYSWTTRAFALWLMSREDKGIDLFDKVWAHRKHLPLYARVWMMGAAHRYGKTGPRDQVLADIRSRVKENARTIHFVESISESDRAGYQLLMHSNVQTDAIVLSNLLAVAPDDPILPKVMAGIMSERDPQKGGRWPTTHANAWALLAANRYFTTVEKEVPDYLARIWLGNDFAGEQAFKGRDMTIREQKIPMKRLLEAGDKELMLSKDGPGKLYYRLGLRYAPADFKMKAEDQGFLVTRTYEAMAQGDAEPDPEAVKRLENGDWQIKVGTTVRVKLQVIARDRANFVVVDDPLPAGLEGQNPKFETTLQDVKGGVTTSDYDYGGLSRRRGSRPWWRRWWWQWDHTDLRDDRMLLFADRMPAGVYTHSYTARATTVGTYQLPPIHAEAMYAPEQFGHNESALVHIVE